MKTYITIGFFVAAIIIALVAMIHEEWALAIWILIEIGLIYNTNKSSNKEKE